MDLAIDKKDIGLSPTTYSSSLDSVKRNRNSFCGRWSLHGPVEHGTRKLWRHGRLACKSWTCPLCGPKKARRLRKAIVHIASEKRLCRLLTLTLNHSSCLPAESIRYLRECWNKMRTYLKQRYSERVTFIAVIELQQSGHAHLHVLIDRYIDHSWIKQAWTAVGGGEIVDIRRVDIHRVTAYLSKYLTKELFLTKHKGGQRRYTTSRDIKLFTLSSSGKWKAVRAPIEFIYSNISTEIVHQQQDATGRIEWFDLKKALHCLGRA